MIQKKGREFVTGHKGLVGSAVVRKLTDRGYKNIITVSRNKLDLRNQKEVFNFFKKKRIDAVINAAGHVGGIYANNKYKADFIYDNLAIQNNIIHACYKKKVKSLIFLGSSCIYPRNAKQPIKEEYLLSGKLEKTNEPYAIAKIAGIKMCESYRREYGCNFISVMPTNLYGINDNFDRYDSHVMPALIRKFAEGKKSNAKEVEIWGTGKPEREFLFVDDLAEAILIIDKKYNDVKPINVGFGEDISIKKLSYKLKFIVSDNYCK